MAKHRLKKVPKAAGRNDAPARLRKALAKRLKGELVELLVRLAMQDRTLFRELGAYIEVETAPDALVAETRQAIADATDFDERYVNHNFRYDSAAYGAVKRNLDRLVALGQLRAAMELSLELMKRGSYQVEMSDEGLMTSDIEECFGAVVEALRNCDLLPSEILAWCDKMTKADRVGFIYDQKLQALRHHFEASPS